MSQILLGESCFKYGGVIFHSHPCDGLSHAQPYADQLSGEASGLETLLEISWQELMSSLQSSTHDIHRDVAEDE